MNVLCLLLLQRLHPSPFSARGTFRPMGIFFLPAAFGWFLTVHVFCPWVCKSAADRRMASLEKFRCERKLPTPLFFPPGRKHRHVCLSKQAFLCLSMTSTYKLVQASIILLNADHMKNLILQNTLQCIASVLKKKKDSVVQTESKRIYQFSNTLAWVKWGHSEDKTDL